MKTLFVLTNLVADYASFSLVDEKSEISKKEVLQVPCRWRFTIQSPEYSSFYPDSKIDYLSLVTVFPYLFATHIKKRLQKNEILEMLEEYTLEFVSKDEAIVSMDESGTAVAHGVVVFLGVQDLGTWQLLQDFFNHQEESIYIGFDRNVRDTEGDFFNDEVTFFTSSSMQETMSYDCLVRSFETIEPNNTCVTLRQCACLKKQEIKEFHYTLS